MTKQLVDKKSPSYTRTARNKTPVLYDGRKMKLKLEGYSQQTRIDVAIIACGVLVSEAPKAAEQLASEGIEATVVDMHTIKPLNPL